MLHPDIPEDAIKDEDEEEEDKRNPDERISSKLSWDTYI